MPFYGRETDEDQKVHRSIGITAISGGLSKKVHTEGATEKGKAGKYI